MSKCRTVDELSIFKDNINLGRKFRWAAFRFYRIIFVSYWPITSPGQIWSYKSRRCWNRRRKKKRRMSKSLNPPSYEQFEIHTTKNDQAIDSTCRAPHLLPSQLERSLFFSLRRGWALAVYKSCVCGCLLCVQQLVTRISHAQYSHSETPAYLFTFQQIHASIISFQT